MLRIGFTTGWAVCLAFLSVNSVDLARAQNGVPQPDHVLIVIEENHSFGQIIGSSSAPYINALAAQGALFTSSYAIRHPSEPNYLALFSGSTHGVSDDSCPHTFASANLASELFDAGLSFTGFSESMPQAGYKGCTSGGYARKHNPWVNFTNVPASANLPFTSLPTDFSQLPTVAIVVPNLDNDMHDGSVGRGDGWLRDHLDPYIQWAMTNNSLFILTWDEGRNGTDNRIVTLFVGSMVQPGIYCERTDHYGLLRTLLDMYGLAAIDKTTNAAPITSAWTADSAPSAVTVAITAPTNGATGLPRGTLELQAEAAASNSVITKVEFFARGIKLGQSTNRPFVLAWTNASVGPHCLVATATDELGRHKTSTSVEVSVAGQDLTPPVVVITTPLQNARVTNGVITLQGTAADNVAVARVEYQVADGPVQPADGTAQWSAQIALPPGPSTIQVRSVDTAGNTSSVATRTLIYVVLSPLTIHLTGRGTVVPDLNGQQLEVGRTYQYRAVPDPGNVLARPDTAAAARGQLSFTMQSNLVLEISFVPNPFPAVAGTYQGLIYNANGITVESSGFWSGSLNPSGHLTGSMRLGGKSYPWSVYFDAFGQAKPTAPAPPGELLAATVVKALFEVDLQLDLSNHTDQVSGGVKRLGIDRMGRVVQEDRIADLFGDRDVFNARTNPAPQAGQYTIIYPGQSEDLASPGGDGFGAVTVDPSGLVRLAGTLADGTKVTQSAALSKAGQWPLYLSLYGGKGMLLGWIGFAHQATNDLQGSVDWLKPSLSSAKYYPNGFTNTSWAAGASYRAPSNTTANVLSVTNAFVAFEGGNLTRPFTNTFRIDVANHVSNTSSNPLALKFTARTGLWKGTVTDPATARSISFQGAVLQGQDSGRGFFLGTNQSGRVRLQGD